MDEYTFPIDPVANPSAVVVGKNYRFTLINDTVLRYEWSEDGQFEDRASTFALNRNLEAPDFTVSEANEHLEIRTADYQVKYNRKRFDQYGFTISFSGKYTLWGADWQYGETTQNLGGTARTLDGVDGRCELEPGILSRAGYSVLDDSASMLFDGNGFVAPRRSGDRIDGYLFCYGHDYKRAMASFYGISGRQPSLPRWALGNWWSRYYAYKDHEYLQLMDKFQQASVPLSVAVIDMDWHLVKGDNVPHSGWTGYTWNKELFPDPPAFTKALHERGLKITLNDHPHAGVHLHEDMYEEMARVLGHDTSSKAPILFNPADPQFMHAYLNVLHRKLENDGCDFWWIDWQQGPYSRTPGLDPLWLLNHFHYLDLEMQDKGKPLIFSRFGGPGSHRYPIGFSGDSVMTWESLKFQPEFTATASNIGYGWWSHDIGGHYGGYRDDELATRWVQFGALSPIMRLHSMNSLWASKEPWLFRKEFSEVMQEYLRFRHRLVPYLYTMNAATAYKDEPIVQPMYWKYPVRDEAYSKPNQYYLGQSLLVAPIVTPRDKRTNLAAVDVWVPPGRHVDIMTGMVYDGNRTIRMHRSIENVPVLASEGSIIVLDDNPAPANGCRNPTAYQILVVVGKDGHLNLHEELDDDVSPSEPAGRTFRDIIIHFNQREGRLSISPVGADREWNIKFVSHVEEHYELLLSESSHISLESKMHMFPGIPGLSVRIPKLTSKDGLVDLQVGRKGAPQLSVLDLTSKAESYILDFQMDMSIKNKLWDIYKSSEPVASKVGQLTTLDLDKELTDPLMELLIADSRQIADE